jgi:signal transduction histidine kinase
MSERFQVPCNIEIDPTVSVADSTTATQLYRIAQEAVRNAIKHARPSQVDIRLEGNGTGVFLTVSDDGTGFTKEPTQSKGLGLRLMSHGAALIGAEFAIRRNNGHGTTVFCNLNQIQNTAQEYDDKI